jgi:hypothetical protein
MAHMQYSRSEKDEQIDVVHFEDDFSRPVIANPLAKRIIYTEKSEQSRNTGSNPIPNRPKQKENTRCMKPISI